MHNSAVKIPASYVIAMAAKKNEIAIVEPATPEIRSLIYVVRGVQVMLDSDLARLYHVETRTLNQAVNRNISRFPKRFCFKLTQADVENLRSQFVISSLEDVPGYGGRRYLPYVFTEQGIAMLSAVLRSDVAVKVSINIMDAFTEMRRFIANNAAMFERISAVELRQLQYQQQTDEKLDKIFTCLSDHKEPAQKIFFEGQIYDAFRLLVRLIRKANKEILLIDSHVNEDTLGDLLSKKNDKVSVTIYTHEKTKLSASDVKKFNEQYPSLVVKYTHAFHDRFLILDKKIVYHIGASLKDAGKKCFAVSRIQDNDFVKDILQRLEQEN